MFIWSTVSRSLKLWSVNQTWKYLSSELRESSLLKFFKNIKFLGEISNSWPNDLLRTNVEKTLKSCW